MWLWIGWSTALIFIEPVNNRRPIRTIYLVHLSDYTAIFWVYQSWIVTKVIQLSTYGSVTEETSTPRQKPEELVLCIAPESAVHEQIACVIHDCPGLVTQSLMSFSRFSKLCD